MSFFIAGHSLTTFELTITRLASKVKQIVGDKIGSRDIEDDESSFGSSASDFEVGSAASTGHEEENGEEKVRSHLCFFLKNCKVKLDLFRKIN